MNILPFAADNIRRCLACEGPCEMPEIEARTARLIYLLERYGPRRITCSDSCSSTETGVAA